MRIIAYLYSDPLLEATPEPTLWGWEIDQVYQDIATEQVNRPQLQQLLIDCQTNPADYLLVRRLEELGDSVHTVSDRLTELETLGMRLISLEPTLQSDDAAIADSELRADLLKLLQQLQYSQRSRRIRQGHARNRVKALPPPGTAPYGYRRSKNRYVIDRATAPVVKDFFEQFILFGSLRAAVRYLEKRYGKKISVSTGRRWLSNLVYRGDLQYQNGEVINDTHAAIVSRDEAAQVDRLLRRNRRLPPRSASAPRSLSGLVTCGACQSAMTISRVAPRKARKTVNATREYLYVRPIACPNLPKCKAIAYDSLLQAAIERICKDLPQAVADATIPDFNQMKQGAEGTIAAKQKILSQLPLLVESGVLDAETSDLRAYKLRTEIAHLQSSLAKLPPANLTAIAQAVSIPQFWLDLSEPERRFYFREFIRQIELVRNQPEWQLKLIFIF